jgi:hypothetical protein
MRNAAEAAVLSLAIAFQPAMSFAQRRVPGALPQQGFKGGSEDHSKLIEVAYRPDNCRVGCYLQVYRRSMCVPSTIPRAMDHHAAAEVRAQSQEAQSRCLSLLI